MRTINYPIKSYRLAKEVTDELTQLKFSSGKSWNLLFIDLLDAYKYKEKPIKRKLSAENS